MAKAVQKSYKMFTILKVTNLTVAFSYQLVGNHAAVRWTINFTINHNLFRKSVSTEQNQIRALNQSFFLRFSSSLINLHF